MARRNDNVEIPISLEITDISMNQVDLGEIEQGLSQRVSGIVRNVERILGNTDTTKFNKALESSFKSVERGYNKVQEAQAKYHDAMRKAGESSREYKARLSEVEAEIKKVQKGWNEFNEFIAPAYNTAQAAFAQGEATPHHKNVIRMYEDEYQQYQSELQTVYDKMPNPMDFVSSGGETELTRIVQRYRELLDAIKSANKAQEDWNTSLKENRATDEYTQMAKNVQKYEQKLASLQEKATKMESLGATDKQWENLIYDANELSRAITETEDKMRKLVSTNKAFRFGKGGLAVGQEYMKLNGVLTRTEKSMQAINNMKPNTMYSAEYSKQLKELSALERKLVSYQEKYAKMQSMGARSADWSSFIYDVQVLESKIQQTTASLQDMVNTGRAFKLGTGNASAELTTLSHRLDTANASLREMQNSPKNMSTSIMGLIRATNEFCKGAETGVKNVIEWFKKLGSVTKRTGKSTHKSLGQMVKDLMMVTFGVGSLLYLIREIRTIFIGAFKEMATQIPEINKDISLFIKSLNQVRGSIGTAFQPIVSAVIPWLHQLSNALTEVLNTIGRFFATLTGQGYIYKFTAAQVDYAKSLDKTSKSAKKAQKSLMGFDEINRLNANDDSSNNSGGNSGEPPTGIYQKEMLNGMNELARLIKEAWKDGDFYEVGQYIGEHLLKALEVADKVITTKGYKLAEKIGKSFATLINGFVETDGLGTQIGTTIADAINMALIGLDKFLYTTNWLSIGQFIADWANASIKSFKWDLLGKTLAGVITAAVNTWWKFVGEFDFTALGKGISTSINNFFSNMLAIDETGLNTAEKLGQAISKTIRGIIKALQTVINKTDWQAVGETIGLILANIDWFAINWDLTKLVASLMLALTEAFASWASTDPLSASFVAVIASALFSIKLVSLFTSFLGIFESFVENVDDLMSFKDIMKVVGKFAKVFAGITTIIAGVATFFTNFFAMLQNGFSWVNEALMVLGAALGAVGAIILGAPAMVAAVIAGIVAAVGTLIVVVKDNWTAISTFFVTAWAKFTSFWTNAWNQFGIILDNAWVSMENFVRTSVIKIQVFVTTTIEKITSFWVNAWNKFGEILDNAWTRMEAFVKNSVMKVKATIQNTINNIKTFWSNAWNKFGEIVNTVWTRMENFVRSSVTSIKTSVSNTVNSIRTTLTNAWNALATSTRTIWNNIANTIKGVVNGIIGFINAMIRGVVGGINKMIGSFNALNIDIPDWVPEFGGQSFGFNIPTIPTPQIPRLAQGGVIPPNNEFMAILGDQKRGTNIEAPLDTIKQAVAEELAEYIDAMMTGFQAVVDAVNDKDFDVSIGDSIIGKAAERYNKRQALIRGTV